VISEHIVRLLDAGQLMGVPDLITDVYSVIQARKKRAGEVLGIQPIKKKHVKVQHRIIHRFLVKHASQESRAIPAAR